VWAGFIFVNLAREPKQSLREFLGPMITALEGYPFDRMTERFGYRTEVHANWKLFMDAFAEFYHAPILHAKQSRERYAAAGQKLGFEAPYYSIDGPHRLVSTSGVRNWEMGDDAVKPSEVLTRGGLFGPWDKPDLGEMPRGVNPGRCKPWGLDSFQLFPNFVILFWGQGWYLTYHYWPTSFNTHTFECTLYFPQARTPRERIGQELAAVTFKEYGLQDANTLEATQSMIESRSVNEFLLCDQEVLIRHLDRIRRAVRVVGRVVVLDAEVRAGFSPDVVGLRWVHADARVDVVRRVRDLARDAGAAVDQAVDEGGVGVQEDLLWRCLCGGLRPVVVLHRDHEHGLHAPGALDPRAILGMGIDATPGEPPGGSG